LQLGKVIGNVVSVKKVENLSGLKLMVVDYLDDNMNAKGKSTVCVDTVSAGKGDIVLLCSSSSARLTEQTKDVCTDNTIVGIVDSVSTSGKYIYNNSDNLE
jgi:microcompartment protein CcmK/EutM